LPNLAADFFRKETGYIEGENVVISYRFAENKIDRLPELADDLVRRQVAVIFTFASGVFAAKAATTTISIVFVLADDPVRLGLVPSIARPGGNLTGINFLNAELGAKRLELLRELVPAATRIVLLGTPTGAYADAALRDTEVAARGAGLQIQVVKVSTSQKIDAAFATFARGRPDALFVSPDPLFRSRRVQLTHLALRHPRDIRLARLLRCRWIDELRRKSVRRSSPGWRIYRSSTQGREACGLTRRASQQVRTGHQRASRQDTRSHCAALAARPRRRGDRIADVLCCGAYVASWPEADLRQTPINVCLLGKSGHHTKRRRHGPLMTRIGHWPAFHVAVAKSVSALSMQSFERIRCLVLSWERA
jgi:hypothetical protein